MNPNDIVTREYKDLRDLACVSKSFYLLQLSSYLSTGHRLIYAHNIALNNVKKNNQRLIKNNRGNRITKEAVYVNDKIIYTTPSGIIYTIEEFYKDKNRSFRVTAPHLYQGIADVGLMPLIRSVYKFASVVRKNENMHDFFRTLNNNQSKSIRSLLSKLRKMNVFEYEQRVLDGMETIKQKK